MRTQVLRAGPDGALPWSNSAELVSNRLELSFPYSPIEHAKALENGRGQRMLLSFFRWAGAGFAMVGLATIPIGLAGNESLGPVLKDALAFVALGSFWYAGAPMILRKLRERELKKEAGAEGRAFETQTFDVEGFRPTSRWSTAIPWSDVESVVETEQHFLFYATSEGPFYLPKDAIPATVARDLRELLQRAFRDRPEDLHMQTVLTR
jgi:hypothetical protein